MRRNPRKLESEEELYAAAVGALARRAHSVFEMRTYLERRSDDTNAVKRVLARLRERKYLDDARYARQFATDRSRLRHQGRYRIARELRTRGVADTYVESALAELAGQTDEAAEVRRQIARHLKSLRGPLDQRRIASLQRGLLRAGFSGDAIRAGIRAIASEDVPELTGVDGEDV
jgi:regulatory protein